MSFNNNIIFNKFLKNIGDFIEFNNTNNNKYNNNLNFSEKINDENHNNLLFYFLLFILVFVFFNNFKITLNHLFSIIIFIIIFYYLLDYNSNIKKNYYNNKKKEIDFLNNFLFNNQQHLNYNLSLKLYSNNYLSYFYLDPYLVDFLYSIKELVNYNSSNYSELLLHCNNILMIKNDINNNLINICQNYQNALLEKNKALNILESIIISLPNNYFFNIKIEKSVEILHSILNSYLNYMLDIIKIKFNKTDLNINDLPLDLLKSNTLINPYNNKDNIHEYFNT